MGRVDGKVCLITGGGSGLGRATAIRLADEGAEVIVADIDQEGGAETVRLAGAKATFMALDVSIEAEWQATILSCLSQFGKLNVLVNNAGIYIAGTAESTTTEDWRAQHSVNTDGVFWGIKYGIDAIKQNDELGSIINISSTAAFLGYPATFAYAASKGAVRSMTKSAAVHCQQEGYKIRVNSLHPSGMDTPMTRGLAAGSSDRQPPTPPANVPGPGIGDPIDVANTVLFLASDESKFINGVELPVDNATIVRP